MHPPRRLWRVWRIWLGAVVGTAFVIAWIQNAWEEGRVRTDLDARLAAASTGAEEVVLAELGRKNQDDRIGRAARRLLRSGTVDLFAVCTFGTRGIWLSEKSKFQVTEGRKGSGTPGDLRSLCSQKGIHELVHAAGRGGPPLIDVLKLGTSQRLRYHARAVRDATRPEAGTAVLVLGKDPSELEAPLRARFLQTFALASLAGILLMGMAGAHIWVRVQRLLQLALLPMRTAPAAPVREVNQDPGSTLLGRLKESLQGFRLVVVANREPYIHHRPEPGQPIRIMRPASGLVSALEPVLRQCGGLWIAHGSGNADAEVCNARGEIEVPPERPKYTLRRIFLSQDEENGYYFGFANEGLWPLCHLAHTRPLFRLADWRSYVEVNRRFAESVPREGNDIALIQDYHFALVPKLLRQSTRARIGLFWHIPWPNAEAFGICPWGPELLEGMLGAHVIGFHTQYHCNNFLETCNRYLEARIDWEKFSVTRDGHETLVRAFPIGIDTPPVRVLSPTALQTLRNRLGIRSRHVAIGVDRIDYTKGLVERIDGVERFLEKFPQYQGEFCLVQVGSPSRSRIPAYAELTRKVEEAIDRVNRRFARPENDWRPILFLEEHQDWDEIQDLYQLGDVCLVTSLHDGMNLVAKEYVWCQQPQKGSLVLSRFTGASRELSEAFLVNPYSTEEIADAIAAALALSPEERTRRMQAMREKIREGTAFHWAARLISSVLESPSTHSSHGAGPTHRDHGDKGHFPFLPIAKSRRSPLQQHG